MKQIVLIGGAGLLSSSAACMSFDSITENQTFSIQKYWMVIANLALHLELVIEKFAEVELLWTSTSSKLIICKSK